MSRYLPSDFYRSIRQDYERFLETEQLRSPIENRIKIDLHCHDCNSDIPDELWGRLLGLPETWLKTKDLVKGLHRSEVDLITITNHNNARSCWSLIDQGLDVLPGAEFTCHFPKNPLSIHVLTYGFSPSQEPILNRLRHDIFAFARYCNEHKLPTVLPHPLYFYSHKAQPTTEVLEFFAVLFNRFEVLNGQRGYWQNQLTRKWVESLDEETIWHYAKKHDLNPYDFNDRPFEKSMTGGSDDHNGIFAGRTGTYLDIPNLEERRKSQPLSDLALEALQNNATHPYGEVGEEEKLTVTFLDYFAQVAINMEDPGLVRMMLHKGDLKDKLWCLGISNAMQELRRHKYTLTFLKTFHEALSGAKPALLTEIGVSKPFKPVLKSVKAIAKTQRKEPEQFLNVIRQSVPDIFKTVTQLFFDRLNEHLQGSLADVSLNSVDDWVKHFEIPTHFRSLVAPLSQPNMSYSDSKKMTKLNVGKLLDELTFPALACSVLVGASFAASQVIYSNRSFLNDLANQLETAQHPERVLWLTDSFCDRNGVSSFLKTALKAIQTYDYPIDILTCHPTLEPEDHLIVLRPVSECKLKRFEDQTFHIPDILTLQRVFEQGGYDRIICSTEFFMGAYALFLSKAFTVPAYFYMHTDWMEFIHKTTQLNQHETDRIRRLLRAYYQQFEGVFTLNNDHRDWLISQDMGLDPKKVFMTSHWVEPSESEIHLSQSRSNRALNLLYAGRISEEKGVFDLPEIMERIWKVYPDAKLTVAGSGPAFESLSMLMPKAHFTGWLSAEALNEHYKAADLLLLPSRFDTFGCVVLEALNHGLPVIAFNEKGPKEIILDGECGFLVDDPAQMAEKSVAYMSNPDSHYPMKCAAHRRASEFTAQPILEKLLADTGIHVE
jgi:glycosyltransferase involved in cell wall biosynthesis